MTKSKKQKSQTKNIERINVDLDFIPANNIKIFLYFALGALSLILSVYYIFNAYSVNGSNGFPLDDPWIHLTFAKNLADYHSFSYFKNEMATAGSTSPIYTFLLAVGFFITNNEMILSYVLGILFLVLSVIAFYKISSLDFKNENFYALFLCLIFVADKWMNFVSVSGMETTMFIFILIAAAYFYRKRNPVLLGIFIGLILWGRPDGITFIAALGFDYALLYYFSKKDDSLKVFSKQDLIKIASAAGILLIAYFAMNLILSGALLPNTYNAKLAYYSPEYKSREGFLKEEVWAYFTSGSYGIVMIGVIISVVFTLKDIFKKKYSRNILYISFIIALIFVYWFKLPYAHRFGRYLMPVIPFLILLSGIGFRDLAKWLAVYFGIKKLAPVLIFSVLGITFVLSLKNYNENKFNYANECKYITDRQVAAAKWINENTAENDIIATHDVGAIGYYSNRKIIDVAGLVTPELISKISDINYVSYMKEFLDKSGVSYLAFLREWYRVVNQPPLFSTADISPVEIMEVFKYDKEKTHILPKVVNSIVMEAAGRFGSRNPQQVQAGMQLLNRSLQYDANSSYTYLLMAYGSSLLGDNSSSEKYLIKALEIYPQYPEALIQLGILYNNTGRSEEAKINISKYLSIKPNDKKAIELLNSINKRNLDSVIVK